VRLLFQALDDQDAIVRRLLLLHVVPLALLQLLVKAPCANADGFVLNKAGRYVREEEQRAFIEWQDGNERLFVMTRTAPSSESTLWILPVPSHPDQVQAGPVAKFPIVRMESNVVTGARQVLKRSATISFLTDTGVVPFCIGAVGGCGGNDKAKDVDVHQHTEKLGMVVEVLTAKTTAGLDSYLTSKQVNTRAANLSALEPYMAGEYSVICAWAAFPSVRPIARALRIDFVSPMVFYPLRPTSVYETPVASSVYVRGWVRYPNGASSPGAKCHYVHGFVEEFDYEAAKDEWKKHRKGDVYEKLTRVELASQPREWQHDLNLVGGAPALVKLSEPIVALDINLPFLLCSVVGLALAPLLALAAIPRGERGWADFVCAALVGVAMGLTVYAAAGVFCIWFGQRSRRIERAEGSRSERGSMSYSWCFFGTFGVYVVCLLTIAASTTRPDLQDIRSLSFLALMLFLAALLSSIFVHRAYKSAGLKSLWLLAFVALHLGAVQLTCRGLASWLTAWE
jgi:hypothetical protein